jgi:hypothetical protein
VDSLWTLCALRLLHTQGVLAHYTNFALVVAGGLPISAMIVAASTPIVIPKEDPKAAIVVRICNVYA